MMGSDGPATRTHARPINAAALFWSEGLHKRFGGVQAVRDITLSVRHGEVFAIIGPNGAGKSTTFNLISVLLATHAGAVRFKGQDVTRWPANTGTPSRDELARETI